ncbi:hypothetical protein BDZ90DRAFT_230849 [Jaminaea rosea]|uniref:Elongation factor 1-beta n=1 Tax=Jaminaea rosea TaxID=1569628 RepID=A0A316UU76_9BASI|nr:hypothetical protein BDZ90DRAFT_230849 [Jaminaea rosea]PWN28839.1 hypothetical protein BDZ90DRAFT_230849 [Jaminaea rosea]
MSLPDFKTDGGLATLEKFLSSRSYIDGYSVSQADVAVFEVCSAPDANKYPNVARWFTHVASFEKEHPNLHGDKKKAAAALAATANTGVQSTAAKAVAVEDNAAGDDDIDLFGSDDEEEDAEAARIKAERVAEYEKKKAAKGPRPAAKSVVTFDVKPWDDETDMAALEENLRKIEKDGLVWGASKLVPVGYGVKKLQITLVVEDEKVSLDELQEQVAEDLEDYVQSTDIAAMQKL